MQSPDLVGVGSAQINLSGSPTWAGCCRPDLAASEKSANTLFLLIVNPSHASILRGGRISEVKMSVSETELLLQGYGLTTAEFFYRMPDYQNVLNTFVWQDYDIAPDHPKLFRFVEFWQDELEGPLHSVRFVHRKELTSGEWQNITGEFTLH